MVRATHTFAELELSKSAYDEISKKLRDAGYDHAFMDNGAIDMHGIGVTAAVSDVDAIAKDAALAIVKTMVDHSGEQHIKFRNRIQAIVAEAIQKCLPK